MSRHRKEILSVAPILRFLLHAERRTIRSREIVQKAGQYRDEPFHAGAEIAKLDEVEASLAELCGATSKLDEDPRRVGGPVVPKRGPVGIAKRIDVPF